MIYFFPTESLSVSSKKRFGICDTTPPPHNPAYIDEEFGTNWIAIVENFYQNKIKFIPIDNCIEIRRPDGTLDNRCDCLLYHDSTIIFVELKERKGKGNNWIKEGEHQLRITISHFEQTSESEYFKIKKAYIANKEKPYFRSSQASRMDAFLNDTGYILRIENRIYIH